MKVNRQDLYMNIFDMIFSPGAEFLCCGNNYGDIAVFPISHVLSLNDAPTKEDLSPLFVFSAHENAVYTLSSTASFLISGSINEIHGYKWDDLKRDHSKKISWSINLPSDNYVLQKPEVNCIDIDDNFLYAACGDNNIYIYDLETRKLVSLLKGHTDFVHCVVAKNANCVSGGEDGVVRFWDKRQKTETLHFEPYKYDKVMRAKQGKWISCLDISDDWMICGGGPFLSLWHIRSLKPTSVFPPLDSATYSALFYEDQVIGAGNSPYVYCCNLNGDILAQIPSSASCIFSVGLHRTNPLIMSIGGTCNQIDISATLRYRDLTLSVYSHK